MESNREQARAVEKISDEGGVEGYKRSFHPFQVAEAWVPWKGFESDGCLTSCGQRPKGNDLQASIHYAEPAEPLDLLGNPWCRPASY